MSLPDEIKAAITRDNYRELLRDQWCIACQRAGAFDTFEEPNNQGVGLVCKCGRKHPLGFVYWLPKGGTVKRAPAPESLMQVLERCGWRCWGCGYDYQVLHDEHHIGFNAHHTRPYADAGHAGALIPLCAYCHQQITLVQRFMRKLLGKAA